MDDISKSGKILIAIAILIVVGLISIPIWLKSIDKHEYAFTFNRFTGEIEPVGRTGWLVINPFRHSISRIDLRPYQLRITANLAVGERILNAKLCRFNPKGLETFIDWHGRKAGNNVENLKEILKCYAFAVDGGESCPFLIVDAEINPKQGMDIEKPKKNERGFEEN